MIKRGDMSLTNEPYVTGGNPVIAGDKTLFNDMLGTTQGSTDGKEFSQINRDAFGQTLDNSTDSGYDYFTGKPKVEGLGYAFLFRNYNAGLGKWTTSDPLGYPDGWNNFAYCNNRTTDCFDWLGGILLSRTITGIVTNYRIVDSITSYTIVYGETTVVSSHTVYYCAWNVEWESFTYNGVTYGGGTDSHAVTNYYDHVCVIYEWSSEADLQEKIKKCKENGAKGLAEDMQEVYDSIHEAGRYTKTIYYPE